MDRINQQLAEPNERRVYTEGPSNLAEDDDDQLEMLDQDETFLDELSPEQFQQLMQNPRLAALFANEANGYALGLDNNDDYGDENGDYEYVDLDNLPNDQQQYFLSDDCYYGNLVQNFNNQDKSQQNESQDGHYNVEFNNQSQAHEEYQKQHMVEGEDGELIQCDADSDYCEDLVEIYSLNGNDDDIIRYKGIHLMDKGGSDPDNDPALDKYQCPETGSHFEFLDMCRRLKKLQTRRQIIDKVIEDEDRRNLALVQKQKFKDNSQNLSNSTAHQKQQNLPTQQQKEQSQSVQQQSQNNHNQSLQQKSQNQSQSKKTTNLQSEFKENNTNNLILADNHSEKGHENLIAEDKIKGLQLLSLKSETQQNLQNQFSQVQSQKEQLIVAKPKIGRMKDPYINKALPTEVNLATDEGFSNSFNFYGTNENIQIQSNRPQNYEEQFSNDEELIDYLNQKPSTLTQKPKLHQSSKSHNQNFLQAKDKNQICVTEVNENIPKSNISKQKQLEYNNFFSSDAQSVHQRNQNLLPNQLDARTLQEMDLLSLSQMLIDQQANAQKNAQIQSQQNVYQYNKSTDKIKKRQNSASNNSKSKKRNNSQSLVQNHNKTHSFNQKQNQIQQMLMSFYQNQNPNSRANYSKSIYENKGNSTLRDQVKQGQPMGPKILVGGPYNSTKPKNQVQISQIYTSLGSNQSKLNTTKNGNLSNKRSKVNIKKNPNNNGLQPRGNTLDNRYNQGSNQSQQYKQQISNMISVQAKNNQQNALGSNSTTAAMNSQSASRPGSAVKKLQGSSPHHYMKGSKLASGGASNEYKNLLFYNKQESQGTDKKEKVSAFNKGQTFQNLEKTTTIHKKNNSVSVTKYSSTGRSKMKHINQKQAPSHQEYNSQALDQILNTQLETQTGDYQYSTFHEGLMTSDQQRVHTMNSNKKTNPFLMNTNSSHKNRQKSTSKIATSKSRQKAELFKPMQIQAHIKQSAKLRTKVSGQNISKIDINNVIKKINLKHNTYLTNVNTNVNTNINPSSLSQQSVVKQKQNMISNQQTQHGSTIHSHQNIQSYLAQATKKVLAQQLDQQSSVNKRYSSIKHSGRENNEKIQSRSKGSNKPQRVSSGNGIKSFSKYHFAQPQSQLEANVLMNKEGKKKNTFVGSSYEYRSERCETVS